MEYDRHRIYVVPASTREPDGSIVIALRVWRAEGKSAGAAGPVEGPFEVGPIGPILERDKLAEAAQLALVLLFVGGGGVPPRAAAAAAGNRGLRLVRPAGARSPAIYAFLRTQWKYMVFDDFVALKKVEHLMIYLVPVDLSAVPVGVLRPAGAARRSGCCRRVCVPAARWRCSRPGLDAALALLPGVQVAAFTAAGAGTVFVMPFIRAGDPEARLLGLGALCVACSRSAATSSSSATSTWRRAPSSTASRCSSSA